MKQYEGSVTLCLFGVVQVAHLTNAIHPIAHIRLAIGSQIVGAFRRFDIEHKLEFLFAILQT